MSVIISSSEFQELAGISERTARKILTPAVLRETWRGVRLAVQTVHGRGGKGGLRYVVRLDSLPADLQEKYWAARAQRPDNGTSASGEVPTDEVTLRKLRPRDAARRLNRKARRRERIVHEVLAGSLGAQDGGAEASHRRDCRA